MANVAGIDLSTKRIAIAIIDTEMTYLRWCELIAGDGDASKRRKDLFNLLHTAFREHPWLAFVGACHIEDISFLRSGRNELDMSKVQGGVQYAYQDLGIPIFQHNNRSVKAMFGLAKRGMDKKDVWDYVNNRFKVKVPSHDVADATITALYGMAQ